MSELSNNGIPNLCHSASETFWHPSPSLFPPLPTL